MLHEHRPTDLGARQGLLLGAEGPDPADLAEWIRPSLGGLFMTRDMRRAARSRRCSCRSFDVSIAVVKVRVGVRPRRIRIRSVRKIGVTQRRFDRARQSAQLDEHIDRWSGRIIGSEPEDRRLAPLGHARTEQRHDRRVHDATLVRALRRDREAQGRGARTPTCRAGTGAPYSLGTARAIGVETLESSAKKSDLDGARCNREHTPFRSRMLAMPSPKRRVVRPSS